MNNPMLNNLNHNKAMESLNQAKTMYNRIRGLSNPQTAINTMAQQNPTLKKALDYVNNNGGDYEKAFFQLASDMGVDPQDIINALK